jgi:phage terminase small subunit
MPKNKKILNFGMGTRFTTFDVGKSKHHYTKRELASIKRRSTLVDKHRKEANLDRKLTNVSLDGLDTPAYINGEAKKIYNEVIAYYRKLGMKWLSSLDLNSLDMYSNEVANYRYSKTRIPEIEDHLDELFDNAKGNMEPKERWKESLECAKTLASLRKDCSDREKIILQLEEHLSLDPKNRKIMQMDSNKKKQELEDPFAKFLSKEESGTKKA